MSTRSVTLTRPIEAHGETVDTLELREPTIGMLKGVRVEMVSDEETGAQSTRMDLGDMPRLISRAAGIPLSSAQRIALPDLSRVMDALGFSSPATPGDGGRSPSARSPSDTGGPRGSSTD